MKPNSDVIKAAVASYWRYTRQCPLVAFECSTKLKSWGGELADVVAVTEGQQLIVVEVKISIADFRRDGKKNQHAQFRHDTGILPVTYFYFAVPSDLANKVSYLCDQLYPYAGVLRCKLPSEFDMEVSEFDVEVSRSPKTLHPKTLYVGQLTKEQITFITRTQTATLCRLAKKVVEVNRVRRKLEVELKEYRDMEALKAGSSEG